MLVSMRSADPSAPRASSSVDLSAGTTSASKWLSTVRASRSVCVERDERLLQVLADRVERHALELVDDARRASPRSPAACSTTVGSSGGVGAASRSSPSARSGSSRATRTAGRSRRLPVASCARRPRCSTMLLHERVAHASLSRPAASRSCSCAGGQLRDHALGIEQRPRRAAARRASRVERQADVGDLADRDAEEADRRADRQAAHRLREVHHVLRRDRLVDLHRR